MANMRLLALDPGITVGVAQYIDGRYDTCVIAKSFETVYNFVMAGEWDVILVEGFSTPGLIAAPGIDTVELIGAIKCMAFIKHTQCITQYPIERRGSLQDAASIMINTLHKKRYPPHEKDALSHILTYFRHNSIKYNYDTGEVEA